MNSIISICIKLSEVDIEKTLSFLLSICSDGYYPNWYQTKNGITIMILSVWKSDIPLLLSYAKQNKLDIRQLVSLEE